MNNERAILPPKNIVTGQHVTPEKAERARVLRHAMTEAEQILWQRLRASRLGGWHFRRQQVITGFIVDFYCHSASLVVEVDGPIHESQVAYDTHRDQVLQDHGLRVLRIKNQDVLRNLDEVLQAIQAACEG